MSDHQSDHGNHDTPPVELEDNQVRRTAADDGAALPPTAYLGGNDPRRNSVDLASALPPLVLPHVHFVEGPPTVIPSRRLTPSPEPVQTRQHNLRGEGQGQWRHVSGRQRTGDRRGEDVEDNHRIERAERQQTVATGSVRPPPPAQGRQGSRGYSATVEDDIRSK